MSNIHIIEYNSTLKRKNATDEHNNIDEFQNIMLNNKGKKTAHFMILFMRNSKKVKIANRLLVRGWWWVGNKEKKGNLLG